MATKQELIDGVRFVAREARRVASHFDDEHWKRKTVDDWTVKEVYCHLLANAEGMTMFLPAIQNLPEGADLGAMFNIDDVNAQGVARNVDKTPAELVEGTARAYEALVPVIEALDQALLDKRIRFSVYNIDMPVSELAASAIILHGLAHTYHCVSVS
jgi:hypothetical protein